DARRRGSRSPLRLRPHPARGRAAPRARHPGADGGRGRRARRRRLGRRRRGAGGRRLRLSRRQLLARRRRGAAPPRGPRESSSAPSADRRARMSARAGIGIWLFALGYFAAYVPYALLTKATTDGSMLGLTAVDGMALLPVTTAVSAIGMLLFLGLSGLWRRANRLRLLGLTLPVPRLATWISGACTALIVVTTTLAYTFD